MKHLFIISIILSSTVVFSQKKDASKPPGNTSQPDTIINLESWAIKDLDALDSEIARATKQATDNQTYLSVLQIRKDDIQRTIVMMDKSANKPPIEKIAKFQRLGNVILLSLKPDSLLAVKPDTVKKK